MQTFLSRQQAASSNRARLAKLLHSVSLYMSCVRSSLIFGLHATGLTDAVLRKLSATDSRHLRAIARSPAHITHESTAELRRRLRVVSPEMALVALLRRRIRACTDPASVADMEQQLKWLTHLTEPTVPGQAGSHCRLVPCSVSIGVACPTCGQYTKQHGPRPERAPTPKSTQYTAHTVDGLPQCRHCLSRFTRAEALQKHLRGACPVLHGGLPPTTLAAGDCYHCFRSVGSFESGGIAWAFVPGPAGSTLACTFDRLSRLPAKPAPKLEAYSCRDSFCDGAPTALRFLPSVGLAAGVLVSSNIFVLRIPGFGLIKLRHRACAQRLA